MSCPVSCIRLLNVVWNFWQGICFFRTFYDRIGPGRVGSGRVKSRFRLRVIVLQVYCTQCTCSCRLLKSAANFSTNRTHMNPQPMMNSGSG